MSVQYFGDIGNKYYRENFIDKQIPNLLVISFILQQIGFSYHLSFGSLGLVLLLYYFRHSISLQSMNSSLMLAPLIVLSYFMVFLRYGYYENMLRVFPTLICTSVLFILFKDNRILKSPSDNVLIFLTLIICAVAWYQVFVDRSFQVPESIFALGSSSSFSDDQKVYDFSDKVLRTNSIYTEPSYFGMVLCALFVLILRCSSPLRLPAIFMIIITQALSGSFLGVTGMVLLIIVLLKNEISFAKIVAGILVFIGTVPTVGFLLKGFDWPIIERVFSVFIGNDASTATRILDPFVLIFENFFNFDWLGIPSDTYSHFIYTNLYNTMETFPGHNGILSLLINFGFLGLLVLVLMGRQLRSPLEWCLVIIIGSQNGCFLTYEKVLSFLFILLALRGSENNAKLLISPKQLT